MSQDGTIQNQSEDEQILESPLLLLSEANAESILVDQLRCQRAKLKLHQSFSDTDDANPKSSNLKSKQGNDKGRPPQKGGVLSDRLTAAGPSKRQGIASLKLRCREAPSLKRKKEVDLMASF